MTERKRHPWTEDHAAAALLALQNAAETAFPDFVRAYRELAEDFERSVTGVAFQIEETARVAGVPVPDHIRRGFQHAKRRAQQEKAERLAQEARVRAAAGAVDAAAALPATKGPPAPRTPDAPPPGDTGRSVLPGAAREAVARWEARSAAPAPSPGPVEAPSSPSRVTDGPPPLPATPPPATGAHGPAEGVQGTLRALTSLRDAGLLSDEEVVAKLRLLAGG